MLYALAGICSVLFLIADQFSKAYFVDVLARGESMPFIDGFIQFTYIDNAGGAWGIMSGHTWIILSLTLLIMIICVAMLIKNGFKSKMLFWSVTMVLSGGIGNMIDRLFRDGKVVDFIHLEFMDFPIFNIADCAVCIGSFLLLIYLIVDILNDRKMRKEHEVIFHQTPESEVVEEQTEAE